jgi:hypothetical protein
LQTDHDFDCRQTSGGVFSVIVITSLESVVNFQMAVLFKDSKARSLQAIDATPNLTMLPLDLADLTNFFNANAFGNQDRPTKVWHFCGEVGLPRCGRNMRAYFAFDRESVSFHINCKYTHESKVQTRYANHARAMTAPLTKFRPRKSEAVSPNRR